MDSKYLGYLRLLLKNGSFSSRIFPLHREEKIWNIGNSERKDCAIRISNPNVAHLHAKLSRDPNGKVWITSIDFEKQTFLDGVNVTEPQILKKGSIITIGDKSFVFYFNSDDKLEINKELDKKQNNPVQNNSNNWSLPANLSLDQTKEIEKIIQEKLKEYSTKTTGGTSSKNKKRLAETDVVRPNVKKRKVEKKEIVLETLSEDDDSSEEDALNSVDALLLDENDIMELEKRDDSSMEIEELENEQDLSNSNLDSNTETSEEQEDECLKPTEEINCTKLKKIKTEKPVKQIIKKKKKKKIKIKKEPEIEHTSNGKLFSGWNFVLTRIGFDHEKEGVSEGENSQNENNFKLGQLIKKQGGKIVPSIPEISSITAKSRSHVLVNDQNAKKISKKKIQKKKIRHKLVLLSSGVHRTAKYLCCLLCNVPCLREDWIYDSIKSDSIQPKGKYKLPAGVINDEYLAQVQYSLQDMFHVLKVEVLLDKKKKGEISQILKLGGAKVVDRSYQQDDSIIVVTTKTGANQPTYLNHLAHKRKDFVSVSWVIDSIIRGEVCDLDEHPIL